MKILQAPNQFQAEIKKSRFIAQALHVESPESAISALKSLSDFSATHNCWAYRIGEQYRFSDDGEPGGTAGKPILSAIDNSHFDQTLVVVTRFYGGIQLGTGGLARAYGSTARQCLQQATSKPLVAQVVLHGFCPYPELGRLKAALEQAQGSIQQEQFASEGVALTLTIPKAKAPWIKQQLLSLTRGQHQLTQI